MDERVVTLFCASLDHHGKHNHHHQHAKNCFQMIALLYCFVAGWIIIIMNITIKIVSIIMLRIIFR